MLWCHARAAFAPGLEAAAGQSRFCWRGYRSRFAPQTRGTAARGAGIPGEVVELAEPTLPSLLPLHAP